MVREPPSDVTEDDVVAAVRRHWGVEVDAVAHLPVGFGAHHWRASAGGGRRLFVTLDPLGSRHSEESLEAAYAGAAALASELDFVVPPLPTASGGFTVGLGRGRLSCTRWVDGRPGGDGGALDDELAEANLAALGRLHTTRPPSGVPRWAPRVGADLADRLSWTLGTPWSTGPYGERARAALSRRAKAIRTWTSRYRALVSSAANRPWVLTHGEPHAANQLRTAIGVVLVDWESLAVAPRERDLRPLVEAGHAADLRPDWPMMELFDLEWRLDEIAQYATWFAAPHTGTESDHVAVDGLLEELDRPE